MIRRIYTYIFLLAVAVLERRYTEQERQYTVRERQYTDTTSDPGSEED